MVRCVDSLCLHVEPRNQDINNHNQFLKIPSPRPPIKILELTKSDAPEYRTLRLRALKEHPTAFSSSYEDKNDWPLGAFAEQLPEIPGPTESFLLG